MTDWTGPDEPLDRRHLPPPGPQVGSPGGKGTVRVVDGSTYYKEYLEPIDDSSNLDELIAWRRALPDDARDWLDARCAWPLRRVHTFRRTTGFLMSPAPDEFWADMLGKRHTVELQHLVHATAAERLGLTLPNRPRRLRLVRDLAALLAFLDDHDMVYGDISEKNVLWTVWGPPRIYLIDCDNARPAGRPNPHAVTARNDNWRDPLLAPGDLPDVDSDRYALAVFYYRVFYGATVSVDQARGKVLLPDDAPRLPQLERLLAAGVGPRRPRPTADQWYEAIRNARRAAPAPVVRDPAAPISARRATGMLLALVALGIAMAVPLIVRGSRDSQATQAPPTSRPPATHSREQSLRAWAAGPVTVKVEHYYSSVNVDADNPWVRIYLRPSLTNRTGARLDVRNAYDNVVLVLDKEPEPQSKLAAVYRIPEAAGEKSLYSLGSSDCCNLGDTAVAWNGTFVEPGGTFSSSRPDENGLAFELPMVETAMKAQFSVAPGKLHVIGVGWLDVNGRMLGFAPVSDWNTPNSAEAFAEP
ncbi:hypothetical protein JIG36_47720 [Actinoplanes sp. LDG1-06]|uniref:Protein kinase domain-containing protein n=1 Tax=Paractinoplanes ovalisporus TaxID=2810368 RepID=A0ABS2AVJ3_9ACTN|nr:hypothetical protein [Actinoplanes ovalisporus]MBM2623211.1 hypothetical protein [Actinoplanes ovalisporus]